MGNSSIILAGGESSRMGANKALANIHGVASIQYLVDFLKEFSDEVLISGEPETYNKFGVKVVADERVGRGPLQGVTTCLQEAKNDDVFIVSADMPLIDATCLNALVDVGHPGSVFKKDGYLMPFPGYYSRSLADVAREQMQQEDRSMHAFIAQSSMKILEPNENENVLQGFNNAEALLRIAHNSIRLDFHGKLTELCNGDNHLLPLPEDRSLKSVMKIVLKRFPVLAEYTTRQANNGRILKEDQAVEPGLLDIMPPFSGG